MAESRPGWSILRVNLDDLDVVFNCGLVLSCRCTILSELVHSVNMTEVSTLSCGLLGIEDVKVGVLRSWIVWTRSRYICSASILVVKS